MINQKENDRTEGKKEEEKQDQFNGMQR